MTLRGRAHGGASGQGHAEASLCRTSTAIPGAGLESLVTDFKNLQDVEGARDNGELMVSQQ